ncbi:stage II sporulation protein E [Clostridium ganghwense]|uniref:Stage II sporulation protein E n=1 Tax=Clostridium ganghwense TaxID=312089 RepID=A0ABT4CSD5_9CLOT|nr:stage II sporulation protein E [Clostridium ganghwense]MCY6371962.1 stage II sporulation protein E [Clostridium ganghwense]
MQYGADIFPYKRFKKASKDKKDKKKIETTELLRGLIYFMVSVLISRVLLLNVENSMAPFGVAFLIAMSLYKEESSFISTACGTLAGYISIYSKINNLPGYLIVIGTITISAYMLEGKAKKVRLSVVFSIIFAELIASEFLIRSLTIKVAFLSSFLQIICIIPLYFILERSIICIKKFRTKHLFSSEEIISMTIVFSLIISGTWGLNIASVSLRNILALTFILMVSYINGSTVGAASGIAVGAIIGISSNNLIIFVGVYGLCGLIAGIFKDIGKWISGFAYGITFFILMLYSNIGLEFKFIEILVAEIIFLVIPSKIYMKINLELDWEKKQEYLNKNSVDKIKNLLLKRLDNFSDVLYNMSDTLIDLADNDKLVMKNKSTGLIENLADRVCSNCSMNDTCWKKEAYYTYAAFGELIQNSEEGKKNKIPREIDRKCIKRSTLLKNTEDIVNSHIIKEMWRKRLSEGREILAGQIDGMANCLKEVMEEFNSDVKIDNEAEKRIRKILDNKSIKFNDIFCFRDKNDRLIIKMSLNSCGGTQLCVKKILPLMNEVSERLMCVSDEGCIIDPETGECTVTFEETPKFYAASYASRQCKNGEKYSGDSYNFGKTVDGGYMCVISDGMGSGPEAGRESKAAVEMMEKFTNAGLSKTTAINTVNTIMTLKFSEDEKFSTLDLYNLDLYSGNVSFMKVGAVASFIKSGNKVDVISSRSLPIGVLDKVDVDVINTKIKNGDVILMLSDGVLDYDINNAGKVEWVVDYLKESTTNNPKELVDGLIEKAKELSGGKVKDDMTAIVSKIYSLY